MKKHIPNILTSLNLVIGCIGIFYTISGQAPEAFYFVILAGLFDFLDGFAARILKVQSDIGKQLDSLSDLVSFGLLPSFYMLGELREISEYHWIALIIAVFSALRLAIFNVDDSQSDSFKGLPTPANAIMITSLIFVPFELFEYTLISICLLSAMLLISPVRLIALKFKSTAFKGNEARWMLLVSLGVLFTVYGYASVPFLIPVYLIVSVVSSFVMKKG